MSPHVDDGHAAVRNAIEALHDISIGVPNDTEREHILKALSALYDADDAFAERSGFDTEPRPMRQLGERGEETHRLAGAEPAQQPTECDQGDVEEAVGELSEAEAVEELGGGASMDVQETDGGEE